MKAIKTTPILLLLMIQLIWADDYGDYLVDTVDKVYDGDTIFVTINSMDPLIGERIGIRINGIDTPEVRGGTTKSKEAANKVRDHVKSLLDNAGSILLKHTDRGKYFRIVADVIVDGRNLTDMLISIGYAKAYDGGGKSAWTDEELDYILEN